MAPKIKNKIKKEKKKEWKTNNKKGKERKSATKKLKVLHNGRCYRSRGGGEGEGGRGRVGEAKADSARTKLCPDLCH